MANKITFDKTDLVAGIVGMLAISSGMFALTTKLDVGDITQVQLAEASKAGFIDITENKGVISYIENKDLYVVQIQDKHYEIEGKFTRVMRSNQGEGFRIIKDADDYYRLEVHNLNKDGSRLVENQNNAKRTTKK